MLASPFLLALAFAPTDFTVGPPGSGAEFGDLQGAVDAASGVGDRVFVLPGTYFGSVTIDKPIDLLGSGPDVTLLSPTIDPKDTTPDPTISVVGLAAGEQVRITGFGAIGVPFIGSEILGTNVVIQGCEGAVTLADLSLGGEQILAVENASEVVLVENSAQVVIDRCTIGASPSLVVSPDGNVEGTVGLRIHASSVWVNASAIDGAPGNASSSLTVGSRSLPGGAGGPGLVALESLVVLAGVQLAGGEGDAGASFFGSPVAGGGAPAARLDGGSFLQVVGGSSASLFGGDGALNDGAQTPVGAGGPGLDLRGSSTTQLAIGVTVQGGFDGQGENQAPPVVDECTDCGSPGIAFFFSSLRTSGTRFQPGEEFTLEVQSAPNAVVAIFSDNVLAAPLALPGFLGLAQLSPAGSEMLIPVLTDDFGFASTTVKVPFGAFAGARRYLQAASIDEFTENAISAPAFATVSF